MTDDNSQIQVPKYYAVLRGKHPGIYRSEKDALAQINDFDHPEMGVFNSEKEAIEYFNQDNGPGKDYYIPAEQVLLPSGSIADEDLGKFNATSDFVTVSKGLPDDNHEMPQPLDNKGNDIAFKPDLTVFITGLDTGFWGYAIIGKEIICDSGLDINVKGLTLMQIALARALEQLYIIGDKDKKIEIAMPSDKLLKAMDLPDVSDINDINPAKQDYIKKQLSRFKTVHLTLANAAYDQKAIAKAKQELNLPEK